MSFKGFRMLTADDPRVDIQPSDFAPPESFTGDDRNEVNHYFHRTEDDSILCGVWTCAPSYEEIESYPANEMMTILAGSLTITSEEDGSETFTAGESLFVPKGSKITWHITETLTKHYLISV